MNEIEKLKELIDGMLDDPGYRQAIARAREETWAHIGESAARTADYMIRKAEELKAADPKNDDRHEG